MFQGSVFRGRNRLVEEGHVPGVIKQLRVGFIKIRIVEVAHIAARLLIEALWNKESVTVLVVDGFRTVFVEIFWLC